MDYGIFFGLAHVNMNGTSRMPERENNLDRELVISAPNAQESPILRRGVQVLTGILILLILAFCFFASSICITVLLSGFLAILADPAVRVLERLWIARFIAAGSILF